MKPFVSKILLNLGAKYISYQTQEGTKLFSPILHGIKISDNATTDTDLSDDINRVLKELESKNLSISVVCLNKRYVTKITVKEKEYKFSLCLELFKHNNENNQKSAWLVFNHIKR